MWDMRRSVNPDAFPKRRRITHDEERPMSLFEFVTVMVSMILALCLGHLLRSASFVAKTDREVKFYLPYTLWSVVILLSVINHWWSLWDLRDTDWSYASFIYILAAPVLLTFATGLLSPGRSNSGPIDLQSQFGRVRRLFSAVFCAYGVFMWFDGPLFAGQDALGAVGALHVPIIASSIVLGLSDNRRTNAIAASVTIAMLMVVVVIRYSTA